MYNTKQFGNNYSIKCCKKNYVIGNKMNLSLIILMTFIYIIILTIWIILLYKIYPIYIFIIGIFFYLIMQYNYILSFLTEPGIIPRKQQSENFASIIENNNNNNYLTTKNSNSGVDLFTENTKSNLESKVEKNKNNIFEEKIIPKKIDFANIKKQSNIFPDFILVEEGGKLPDKKKIINDYDNILIKTDNVVEDSMLNKIEMDNIIKKNPEFDNPNAEKFKNSDSSAMANIYPISKIISEKDKKPKYIPNIYKKRFCATCNIIRPEKASHCVICDNCILEMDHHCFYISNCVGIRNRKNFVLFLLFGFLFSLLCEISSLYHILYVFFIKIEYRNITIIMIKKYYVIISLCILFMLVGLGIILFKKNSLWISATIFVIGNLGFDAIFYFNMKKIYKKLYFYGDYHPWSISTAYAVFPLLLLVGNNLRKQFKLIGKGITTKIYVSIRRERDSKKNEIGVYKYLDSLLKKKVNVWLIVKFFFSKTPSSLINN